MTKPKNRPEDLLPGSVNFITVNGVEIRKGSMASFITNLNIIEDDNRSETDKHAAWERVAELIPVIKASGLLQHVSWKNNKLIQLLQTSN